MEFIQNTNKGSQLDTLSTAATKSAESVIAAVPKQHPFDIKYQRIEKIDWESCERVLPPAAKRASLVKGW